MASGHWARTLLTRARRDPDFRDRLIALGASADNMTYESPQAFLAFAPQMLEIASEAGLLEGMDQKGMDELIAWFCDSANELAFLVTPRPLLPPSRRYRKPVGYVFLSWTVKNPRDRAAMLGIKDALSWFGVEHFDYTEHQLDDTSDIAGQIEQQLEDAIRKARVSIETVSTEVGRPWVRHERDLINHCTHIHRFLVCLEWEKARFVRFANKDRENRVTRIDMSGGRSGTMPTATMQEWMQEASDTSYFESPDFFFRAYAIARTLRATLVPVKRANPFFAVWDFISGYQDRDRSSFVLKQAWLRNRFWRKGSFMAKWTEKKRRRKA